MTPARHTSDALEEDFSPINRTKKMEGVNFTALHRAQHWNTWESNIWTSSVFCEHVKLVFLGCKCRKLGTLKGIFQGFSIPSWCHLYIWWFILNHWGNNMHRGIYLEKVFSWHFLPAGVSQYRVHHSCSWSQQMAESCCLGCTSHHEALGTRAAHWVPLN